MEKALKSNNAVSETSSGGYPKFPLYAYKYEGGATLLHLAALSGNLSIISLLTSEKVVSDLIEINSRVEAGFERDGGSEGGHINKFSNILKDALNAYDDVSNTPIHMAALSGNVVMFEYMIYLGSDPKRLGFMGKTVLHYAASRGHWELCQYLIYDALPYPSLIALDHSGSSASMNAFAAGYKQLGAMIKESTEEVRTKLLGK